MKHVMKTEAVMVQAKKKPTQRVGEDLSMQTNE